MKRISIYWLMAVVIAASISNAEVVSQLSGDYGDSVTWGGRVPGAGSFVQIVSNHVITLNSGVYSCKHLDMGVNASDDPTFTINGGSFSSTGIRLGLNDGNSTVNQTGGDVSILDGAQLWYGTGHTVYNYSGGSLTCGYLWFANGDSEFNVIGSAGSGVTVAENFDLDKNDSGALKKLSFVFDANGVSTITCAKGFRYGVNSIIAIDGSAYIGSSNTFILVAAGWLTDAGFNPSNLVVTGFNKYSTAVEFSGSNLVVTVIPRLIALGKDASSLMGENFPKAFFFRMPEYELNAATDYDWWERTFNRLGGIMGKVLDEEVPGRGLRHPEFFTRFKNDNPDQLVLLHFNGNSRDPRYEPEKFFSGHWVYGSAVEILSDIPAESGETVIQVSNTTQFKTNSGRFGNSPSDIGLFKISNDGIHDWEHSEQVQLVSVDAAAGTIRVKRGCYGTVPQAFDAGDARAAVHIVKGPWAKRDGHLLWIYNFSTRCPVDSNGNTCSDVLVRDLCEKLLPGGMLSAFDGIEFDAPRTSREGDLDGDGKWDDGIVDGINTFAVGVSEFYRRMHEVLGDAYLVLADGCLVDNQRAFGLINGIESEGWPVMIDSEIETWSSGFNRHRFWSRESREPILNYINHKFDASDIPFSTTRLVFAAAQFLDAAVCYILLPNPEAGESIGIWDELKKGSENQMGWLGKAEGPAVHLAEASTNLILRKRSPWTTVRDGKRSLELEIDNPSSNLFVTVQAHGAPLTGYPESYGRLMEVNIGSDYPTLMSWLNSASFDSSYYFRGITESKVTLTIEVEGTEPVEIDSVCAYSAPDVMYRVFENGIVLANPSLSLYTFDLNALTPGRTYRRLTGSSKQDPGVNNGERVGSFVTLGPRDGLFLVRAADTGLMLQITGKNND